MIINYKKGIIWTNSDLICSELYIRINNFTTYISIPERITIYKVADYINLAKSFIDNYIEHNTDTSAGSITPFKEGRVLLDNYSDLIRV